MKVIKFEMNFEHKAGFSREGLEDAIKKSVEEVGYELKSFVCKLDNLNSCSEIPALNEKSSRCVCEVVLHETGGIPAHQILFGGIMNLQKEYPYIEPKDIYKVELFEE